MLVSVVLLSLLGMLISVVLGTVWYAPNTPMGRLHMRYLGFDTLTPQEQSVVVAAAKPTKWKTYAGQMALSLLTSFFVVFVILISVHNGVPYLVAIWFPVMGWLCFTIPSIGSGILWSNIQSGIAWRKFFSDSALSLVTIVAIALVVGLFI